MTRERQPSRYRSGTDKNRPVRRRDKYTRRACETCKTRKVKCSGLVPCSRCVELRVECLYQDSSSETASDLVAPCHVAKRRRTSNLSINGTDLSQLVLTMRKVCDDIESSASNHGLAPIPFCSLRRSRRQFVSGNLTSARPTPSHVHILSLARDVLVEKGFFQDCTDQTDSECPETRDEPNVAVPAPADEVFRAAKPILHLGHDKAFGYYATFRDHVYSAYPCVNLSVCEERITALYSASTPSGEGHQFQDLGLDVIDVELMKVTFAIAMILEGEGEDTLCRDLTAHLLWNVDDNINEERAQIEDVMMATLLTIYLTLRNQSLKAWRMTRYAATTSLELGLHRDRPAEERDRTPTLHSRDIFSCVYDLDRRCSFFASLPWTLHHKDIDSNVLSLDDRHPFMSAMLRLDRVHTEVVRFNAAPPPSGSKETDEQTELYDYRVQKLVENTFSQGLFQAYPDLAPEIRCTMTSVLQLRACQVRMSAYMRYLDGSCDDSLFRRQAIHVLVSLATSSVDTFLGMTGASPLWRPLADRLLMRSISYMFLAASRDPGKYGPLCRRAFHTAIDCLERSSYKLTESESAVWRSLGDLKTLGAKIEMPPLEEASLDGTSPVECLDSITAFGGDLDIPVEELTQICEDTNHDPMSGLWGPTSLWEENFGEIELV